MGGKASKADSGNDPDDVWSNKFREREKNDLYKWGAPDGVLVKLFESKGEDGILRFAEEHIEPMLYEGGPRVIGAQEYNIWKTQMITEFGLTESTSEDLDERFEEHKALWRLNKRGIEGESLIHILLHNEDTMCHEVARILIKKYPGLSGDIYMSDTYLGQSALHLAIINNDYETAQLLLQNGARVNARACGTFFMPDFFRSKKKMRNYDGIAYFGEYPLGFAACCGTKDMYDLLMEHNADPSLQDTFGNTILHMCVISDNSSMYMYAVKHCKKMANPLITNNNRLTPLTLASKLGRPRIFEHMLDLSKVEFWRFSDMACSAYPIAALDSLNLDGSTNYSSALMTVINGRTEEHLDMVGSEVIQRLLAYKWEAYAKFGLYKRMIILIVQLIFLSIAAYLRPTETDRLYFKTEKTDDHIHTGKLETKDHFGPRADDWIRLICEIVTLGFCVHFLVQQANEIRAQGWHSYRKNMKSTPARMVYGLSNILLVVCVPFRFTQLYEIEECLLALAIPGTFIYGLFFARNFKLTGPLVQIFYTMCASDLALYLIISSIFMFPFCFALHFLGRDIDAKEKLEKHSEFWCKREEFTVFYTYSTPFEAFITLLRANIKGFDYEELVCHNYQLFAKLLMLLYLLVMAVMMMAIAISMMANTFNRIIGRAEKAWRQQTAQIIMNLERSMDTKTLAMHLARYSITLHENTSARGLMVVKKTNQSRTDARRNAARKWKFIGRKVIKAIAKIGAEMALETLHGHVELAIIEKQPMEKRRVETRHGIANVVAELIYSHPHLSPRAATYIKSEAPPEIPPPDPAPSTSTEGPRPLTATVLARPKTRRYLTTSGVEDNPKKYKLMNLASGALASVGKSLFLGCSRRLSLRTIEQRRTLLKQQWRTLATASTAAKKVNLNVGTIGHIDHGKTTLTAAITHVLAKKGLAKPIKFDEIDKGKEEKKRGITINIAHIGYESPNRRYSHTDCPGHADFIKNMICGTAQMDAAVLVIAATDGVMAQTKEHLILARQIGLKNIIVFINKVDLVEEDVLDLVELEARELLSLHGFDGDNACVIRGSALEALEGSNIKCIDELMSALDGIPEPTRNENEKFVMPVASKVAITGRGTVVVGTVETGVLKKGEKVEIKGDGDIVNATASDIQVFGKSVKEVRAGDHCGILCRGIKQDDVRRGMWMGHVGTITATNHVKAEIYLLSEEENGRKTGIRTGFTDKLFCSTWDQVGRFELLGQEMLMPGEHSAANIFLIRDMPFKIGMSFTLREGRSKQTLARGIISELLPSMKIENFNLKKAVETEK